MKEVSSIRPFVVIFVVFIGLFIAGPGYADLSHIGAPFASVAALPTSTNETAAANFSTYDNPSLGIKFHYPSGWTGYYTGLSYPQIIRFYSPKQNLSDFLPARVTLSVTQYSTNITLPALTNFRLSTLNQSQFGGPQLTIKNSSSITISGSPGQKVIYSITLPASRNNTAIEFDMMDAWTVINNGLYMISYNAQPQKFMKYLPDVDQIIASMQISKK